MANSFWNFTLTFVAGTTAKAEDVNSNLTGIQSGFDLVEAELNKSIQITNAAGVTDISSNAAARANMIIAFDSSGDVTATTTIGTNRGDHADAAGTDYYVRDIVKDAAGSIGQDNIYQCTADHTSTGGLSADSANWTLLVDAASAAASATAAANSATAAGNSETAAGNSESAAAASAASLNGSAAVSSSATPAFDMNGDQTQHIKALTHDPAPTLSNKADGRSITVIMTASGADRTITYDADWVQIGSLPTSIPDGKTLMLSFVALGTDDTDVYVTGSVEI